MCELGFVIFLPYCPALGEGSGLVLGGSTEDMAEQYLFLWCIMVSICGGLGRFVPMVMVVERGDATGVHGFFKY
jgi:hypothetical protein